MAEPAAAPQIAALLLNWRRADLTLRCLHDLLAVAAPALRVVVLDNGSGAEEVAALQRGVAAAAAHGPHAVELVALPANLGFTGGMNEGIRRAHAAGQTYALVLNNDLRLPPDFLAPLVATLANDPQVAAVGPTVLHPDGTVWAQGGERRFAPNGIVLRGHGKAPAPTTAGPAAVDFLPCACALFRTADLVAIGGFDDAYFMYWEDVDLCERLRARGGRIVWLPWVRIEHAAGQSAGGERSPARKFLMACNAVRSLRAHGSPCAWLAWFVCDVLGWPLALLQGPRGAWAKLCGTLAGLRGHRAGATDVARWHAT
ncbi:MAG: glycosyltransferase [Planctomycetes bacterium]|nr:glycosyltransferase [Planctomycetota bacterium]